MRLVSDYYSDIVLEARLHPLTSLSQIPCNGIQGDVNEKVDVGSCKKPLAVPQQG